MNAWLITPDAYSVVSKALAANHALTDAMHAEFKASLDGGDYPGARIMSKIGGVAQINIGGVLTREPSWLLRYFGGGNTAYSEIISAINEAERDPNIESVIFNIDSPGGNTSGLTAAMDAIDGMSIPTEAIVSGMAASAAYGLASQTDKITATDRGAMFGSIGVKGTYYVDEHVIEVTSSNAPEKAPDVTTDEGKAQARKTLDAIESIFIEDIAQGRGVSPDKVRSDFGRGGLFLANDAKTHGMIDEIQKNYDRTQEPGAITTTQEAKVMNLQELQSKYPGVFAEAVAVGVAQEKDRVSAHLTMGEATGAMDIASKAIKDGTAMTMSMQSDYMAAGFKNGQIGAANTDAATAAAALAGVTPGANVNDSTADAKAYAEAMGIPL